MEDTTNPLVAAIAAAQAKAQQDAEIRAAAAAAGNPRQVPGPAPSQRPENPNAITPEQYAAYMQQARDHTASINNMPHVLNPNAMIGQSPDAIKTLMYPGSPLGAMLGNGGSFATGGAGGGPVGGSYDINGNYISPALTPGQGGSIGNPLFQVPN